jgi:hypothetical protein
MLADVSIVIDPLVGIAMVGAFSVWAFTVVWFASAANQRLKGIEENTYGLPDRVTRLETHVGIDPPTKPRVRGSHA